MAACVGWALLKRQRPGGAGVSASIAHAADKAWAEQAGWGLDRQERQRESTASGSGSLRPPAHHLELPPDAPAEPLLRQLQPLQSMPAPTGANCEPFVWMPAGCIAFQRSETRDARLCRRRSAPRWAPWVAFANICQDVLPWNHSL